MTENHISRLDAAIRDLVEVSDMIDRFDLVSADQDSSQRFRVLQANYVSRILELMEMVEENGNEIRSELDALLRVS